MRIPSPASSVDAVEYLDVVDAQDRPLAVLPYAEVHRQSLMHRSVLVLVYQASGKLYLQKRAKNKSLYPGRWDLSATGHVRAGESREDAACRELEEELGITGPRLTVRHTIPASPATNHEHVTLYAAGVVSQPPRPNPDELEGGMFVDSDELDYLAEHFRDMLTPGLVYFWEKGMLFEPL
ncbi:MAG: NUDIX domain-containing protein [Desulfovibrionaceae bacterium]